MAQSAPDDVTWLSFISASHELYARLHHDLPQQRAASIFKWTVWLLSYCAPLQLRIMSARAWARSQVHKLRLHAEHLRLHMKLLWYRAVLLLLCVARQVIKWWVRAPPGTPSQALVAQPTPEASQAESPFSRLDAHLLSAVLERTHPILQPWAVCRAWRDASATPQGMAAMLVHTHGHRRALLAAVWSGKGAVVDQLLHWPDVSCRPDANRGDGVLLIFAVRNGRTHIVRSLLSAPSSAPRADCRDGLALVAAAAHGHADIVSMLLSWPEHAPRADCGHGRALFAALAAGHVHVANMLLKHWPAEGGDPQHLVAAASLMHAQVVGPVLAWLQAHGWHQSLIR